MKKILAFAAAYVSANIALGLFFTFVAWGESPATWMPESRFMVAFICTAAGAMAGVFAATQVKP